MLANVLRERGHDAIHLREIARASSDDIEVMRVALVSNRIVVSRDTDFGALLAASVASAPSVILLRRRGLNRPEQQSEAIEEVLKNQSAALRSGAIVVIDRERVRVRELPVHKAEPTK